MGAQDSKIANMNQGQKKAILEAAEIVKQLKSATTQGELRFQRHLISRILLYGQRHLVSHLMRFSSERRKIFMRILQTLDFETIDMLYQNKIKNQKQNPKIEEFDKFQYLEMEKLRKQKQYEKIVAKGKKLFLNKKVGVILFIGGSSSRFVDEEGVVHDKAFYTQNQNEECLLSITLKRIQKKFKEYAQQELYIVHNEQNLHKLNKVLTDFKGLKSKKVLQNIQYMVNRNGKFCLRSQNNCEILHSPFGCGDFYRLIYRDKNIIQCLRESKIEYVCCLGIQNIHEHVLDYYMLGFIDKNDDNCDMVFKCTYPEKKNQNLKRIVVRKDKKAKNKIVIEDYRQLLKMSRQEGVVEQSPVWMNSLIFKLQKFNSYLKMMPQLLGKKDEQINMTTSTKIMKYWDSEQQIQVSQQCYIFERQLSDVLVNTYMKSTGIMVSRQEQFMPIISINEEHIWKQAYKQHISEQQKSVLRNSLQIHSQNQDSFLTNNLEGHTEQRFVFQL